VKNGKITSGNYSNETPQYEQMFLNIAFTHSFLVVQKGSARI